MTNADRKILNFHCKKKSPYLFRLVYVEWTFQSNRHISDKILDIEYINTTETRRTVQNATRQCRKKRFWNRPVLINFNEISIRMVQQINCKLFHLENFFGFHRQFSAIYTRPNCVNPRILQSSYAILLKLEKLKFFG